MIGKIKKSKETQAEPRAGDADRARRITKLTNGVSVAAFLIILAVFCGAAATLSKLAH
jgi:hypothetical protein